MISLYLKINLKYFFNFCAWPLGIHTVTFCISEIRGRIKAWFDAQGRVQTYKGLVYIGVTRVVSTFIYIGKLHIFTYNQFEISISSWTSKEMRYSSCILKKSPQWSLISLYPPCAPKSIDGDASYYSGCLITTWLGGIAKTGTRGPNQTWLRPYSRMIKFSEIRTVQIRFYVRIRICIQKIQNLKILLMTCVCNKMLSFYMFYMSCWLCKKKKTCWDGNNERPCWICHKMMPWFHLWQQDDVLSCNKMSNVEFATRCQMLNLLQ